MSHLRPYFHHSNSSIFIFKCSLIKTKKGLKIKDFKDPRATRDFNYAILLKEFDLSMEIPLHFLTPPVPNRLDYILHVEDLLASAAKVQNGIKRKFNQDEPIFGIDIGTGASCIYPLLGAKLHSNWKFLAIDINKESVEYGLNNVKRNALSDQINVVQSKSTHIFPKRLLGKIKYDFVICNPPFYSSLEELHERRDFKDRPPFGVCTGSPNELITAGGELQFIKKMIGESIKKQKQITWFTTLVGVQSHAYELKALLDSLTEPVECRLDSYRQGYTTRWILSWKFNFCKRIKPEFDCKQ